MRSSAHDYLPRRRSVHVLGRAFDQALRAGHVAMLRAAHVLAQQRHYEDLRARAIDVEFHEVDDQGRPIPPKGISVDLTCDEAPEA